jgi:hypothetical protein
MRFFWVLLTVALTGTYPLYAQSAEDSVKSVVNQLFDGMKNPNPVKLRAAFADSAILQTIIKDKNGSVKVVNESLQEFIDFAGQQKQGDADERIHFETIKIEGALAIVWAPYQFYYKGKFSHCGTDSFQLVKLNGNWEIQYLIDTRRKQGCQ